ncbi:hypothetical protein NEOLEDRAFT_1077248 [Neolentinus lepideus HHB14362 ss-1]|uniref:Uncharacterized protein n=1 Tax=Neolentinus lepideus HHB14362 ss-1 TaxID=1314782 RepID=A0A165NKT8_9AGAM|nr:hypothetical protein NEOLEDRAFT_1077248 [Neolentinus lepideus HHB14362 ss-1]
MCRVGEVAKLANGSLVLEIQTCEGADHICQHRFTFLAAFEPSAAICEHPHPLIVRFIPIHFWPDCPEDMHEIEEQNRWDKNTIIKAWWIKPEEK